MIKESLMVANAQGCSRKYLLAKNIKIHPGDILVVHNVSEIAPNSLAKTQNEYSFYEVLPTHGKYPRVIKRQSALSLVYSSDDYDLVSVVPSNLVVGKQHRLYSENNFLMITSELIVKEFYNDKYRYLNRISKSAK